MTNAWDLANGLAELESSSFAVDPSMDSDSDSDLFLFVEDLAAWERDWRRRNSAGQIVRQTSQVQSREDLFRLFARELKFPCYFGENWDAFEECLNDLSWWPTTTPIALVHEVSPLWRAPEDREIYLTILQEAIHSRRVEDVRPELIAVFDRHDPATFHKHRL